METIAVALIKLRLRIDEFLLNNAAYSFHDVVSAGRFFKLSATYAIRSISRFGLGAVHDHTGWT